jgi:Rhs element Vgr protein
MPAITLTINNADQSLNSKYKILSVDVIKEVNRVPSAEIILVDGSIPKQTFSLSEENFFNLGNEIEIKIRREGSDDYSLFKGLISKQNIEASQYGSQLTVSLDDVCIKATQLRHSEVHQELSDSDIITNLIEKHQLTVGTVEATEPVHSELFQYNCTDWDFMLLRAQSQGLLINVDDGVVSLIAIDLTASPDHKFEYGIGGRQGIKSVEMQNNALANFEGIKTQTWDIGEQQNSEIEANRELSLKQGDFSVVNHAETFSSQMQSVAAPIALNSQEVQAWVNGKLVRSRLARFTGSISVTGIGDIKPLQMVELKGLGSRFNGNALVTGVRHRVSSSQGWMSDLQLGLSDKNFAASSDLNDLAASGLLSGINSLCIAKVASFEEEDPEGEFRIKVNIVALGEESITIWARLANMDAGKDHGCLFYPEPGDEVVVGFFNQDPRHGVILGSMYSSANPPFSDWKALDEDNFKKGILTKSGSKIEFSDEEDAKVTISTALNSTILLDDKAQEISLSDAHGNSILMSEKGIRIISCKDIILDAKEKVSIKGSEVDVK